MWQHGDVAWAMFETMLMAFLGTFGAAIIALPLGLSGRVATSCRCAPLRFAMRRVFDFIRGVDALIWTIILARAFGPGPMTGALAILITDTGSLRQDSSPRRWRTSTKSRSKASAPPAPTALQRARFGVIPQVTPVLLQPGAVLSSNPTPAAPR